MSTVGDDGVDVDGVDGLDGVDGVEEQAVAGQYAASSSVTVTRSSDVRFIQGIQ